METVTIAMAEEEILEKVSIFGYNKKRLEEGKALLDTLKAKNDNMHTKHADMGSSRRKGKKTPRGASGGSLFAKSSAKTLGN